MPNLTLLEIIERLEDNERVSTKDSEILTELQTKDFKDWTLRDVHQLKIIHDRYLLEK